MNGRKLVLEFLAIAAFISVIGILAIVYFDLNIPFFIAFCIGSAVSALLVADKIALPDIKEYRRGKALRPQIPALLLQSTPISNSVIFGKDIYSDKYVMKQPNEIQHTMIVGQTGSGKTACILLPSIYSCITDSKQILDIKSRELMLKSADLESDRTFVVDLNRDDEFCYGWDVFYKLNDNSNEHDILNVFEEIASIILPDAKTGDQFWTQAGRNLFIGLGIYEYLHGNKHNFVEVIGTMLSVPLREHLETALNTVTKDSLTASFLTAYRDTEDETLMSIQITMTQPLYIFLQKDVQYAFKLNPQKADPTLLNINGVSMYLCVDENRLDSGYDKLIQIILKQTLAEIQSRETTYNGPITNLFWDEFGRCCDSCPDLLRTTSSFLKTARSKRANLTMAVQSLDSFDKKILYDLLANITYLLVLNCSNANSLTAEVTCKLAGKYYEKALTFNSGKNRHTSTNFEEKDILKAGDLNVLGAEAILLVSNYGYFRTDKSRTAYYKFEPYKSKFETIYKKNTKKLIATPPNEAISTMITM